MFPRVQEGQHSGVMVLACDEGVFVFRNGSRRGRKLAKARWQFNLQTEQVAA